MMPTVTPRAYKLVLVETKVPAAHARQDREAAPLLAPRIAAHAILIAMSQRDRFPRREFL
jgi:hypothetical protein